LDSIRLSMKIFQIARVGARPAVGAHFAGPRYILKASKLLAMVLDSYQAIAKPFEWSFTRKDQAQLMARLVQKLPGVQRVA
jgi:hypothetical protein